MQHIEPHNDDLFKKAAKNYPLRTDAGRWENIAGKLDAFDRRNIKGIKYNYRNITYRSVLVFVLLLSPFVITVTKYFNENYNQTLATSVKIDHNKNESTETKKKEVSSRGINKRINNIAFAVPIERSIFNESTSVEKMKENAFNPMMLSNIEIQKNLNNKVSPLKTEDKKIVNDASKNSEEKKSVKTRTNNYKGFYIGGAFAPELTSVKFQPARKSYDIGLLVGYNLNKKLSIELGFMLAKKYYYTSGKYIVPNTMGLENSKILVLNAFTSMTEMPLTIQYNLRNKNNSKIFVNGGMVSYILHKENYNYVYKKDGERMHGTTLNNKPSQSWFSNVQMSLGYEHSFDKICNVRIEPYCRIPLKGIGISDLPVSSVGVNFAIIKPIK